MNDPRRWLLSPGLLIPNSYSWGGVRESRRRGTEGRRSHAALDGLESARVWWRRDEGEARMEELEALKSGKDVGFRGAIKRSYKKAWNRPGTDPPRAWQWQQGRGMGRPAGLLVVEAAGRVSGWIRRWKRKHRPHL